MSKTVRSVFSADAELKTLRPRGKGNSKLRQIGSAISSPCRYQEWTAAWPCMHTTRLCSPYSLLVPHTTAAVWPHGPIPRKKKHGSARPLVKFLEIPFEAFQELCTDRICKISKSIPVHPTPIYSTSSRKTHESMCNLLKHTVEKPQGEDEMVLHWNDGVFYVNEIKWGSHLISFEGDYTEIMGVSLNVNCAPLFRLAMENARRHELHREDRIAS